MNRRRPLLAVGTVGGVIAKAVVVLRNFRVARLSTK